MKKLSLLIALILCATIGSVYANWVYIQTDDVADITGSKVITLTEATFDGNYGTYHIDTTQVSLTIDPKEGTSHTTALTITGDITLTFKPNVNATVDVKNNAIPTTVTISLSNANWKYKDTAILTIANPVINVNWTKGADGVFTYTISAQDLASHLTLTEFVLDTKTAYDEYDGILTQGQIVFAVSDGKTSATV